MEEARDAEKRKHRPVNQFNASPRHAIRTHAHKRTTVLCGFVEYYVATCIGIEPHFMSIGRCIAFAFALADIIYCDKCGNIVQ